jgi:hypothetical protein
VEIVGNSNVVNWNCAQHRSSWSAGNLHKWRMQKMRRMLLLLLLMV